MILVSKFAKGRLRDHPLRYAFSAFRNTSSSKLPKRRLEEGPRKAAIPYIQRKQQSKPGRQARIASISPSKVSSFCTRTPRRPQKHSNQYSFDYQKSPYSRLEQIEWQIRLDALAQVPIWIQYGSNSRACVI